MKKVHVVMYAALLLLFCCACSQAQQSLASSRNNDSNADGQVVKNATGKGTTDYDPLWLSTTKLGNSNIFQSPAGVGIGTTAPAATLDVNGAVNAATGYNLGVFFHGLLPDRIRCDDPLPALIGGYAHYIASRPESSRHRAGAAL